MSEEHPQSPPSAPEREPSVHQHGHSHLPKFGFLEELKRRNVGRVAILYIILGYVVLEIFGVFVHLLDLPPWVGRSAVLLLVLGFPVALLVAWIYEITPEGLKPTEQVAPHQSIRHLTGRRLDRAIIAVLAIALAYFITDKFWLSKHVTSPSEQATTTNATTTTALTPNIAVTAPEKSVAVLPFVDMSEKHDQEYFSDGLSEELINMLTRATDLRVPARTSSFYFKGKATTIADIARVLNVAQVLEGSVRSSGSHLRITVQLIRVSDGYHIWSETYNRTRGDIFKIQDDIARAVVTALKASFPRTNSPLANTASSEEAYRLYLQGRAVFHTAANDAGYAAASDYMKQAIRIDPTYAESWAWLAFSLANQYYSHTGVRTELAGQIRKASQQALTLAPDLASAHAAVATTYWFVDRNFRQAAVEFQRSIDLDPMSGGYATALAELLFEIDGPSDAVLNLYRKAVVVDPANFSCHSQLANYFLYVGRFPEAEKEARKAIEFMPSADELHTLVGEILLASGRPAEALVEFHRNADAGSRRRGEALAYFAIGRKTEADSALTQMLTLDASQNASGIADIYAYRGETEHAFYWLERAYQQRDSGLENISTNWLLQRLHGDARWKDFLRKAGLGQ